jgi:hypothetical protein
MQRHPSRVDGQGPPAWDARLLRLSRQQQTSIFHLLPD